MATETVGEAGADMVGEREILLPTKDLCPLSDGRPSRNGMAWGGSGLRQNPSCLPVHKRQGDPVITARLGAKATASWEEPGPG